MQRCASVLCLLLSTGALFAQTQRGTIAGTITDSSGAVVPNVSVQVLQGETGAKFSAISNQTGYYSIPYFAVWHYQLTANSAGFKNYVVQAIEVAAATTTTLNIVLQVGDATEQISVAASTVLLETNTSAISAGVEEKLKDDLPVANRRDPLTYLNTVPGYAPSNQSVLAGARYGSNNILLDGQSPDLNISAQGTNGTPLLPE